MYCGLVDANAESFVFLRKTMMMIMMKPHSTTRGSIITRVDDELCQKLICRCRQARKSGAAPPAPRATAAAANLNKSVASVRHAPGFGPCHNTSLRTFDFPSAAAADLLLLFFAWLVASLMPPSLTSLNHPAAFYLNLAFQFQYLSTISTFVTMTIIVASLGLVCPQSNTHPDPVA